MKRRAGNGPPFLLVDNPFFCLVLSKGMKELLSIPANLFRSVCVRHTDRYLIYRMIGRHVSFRALNGAKVAGYVDNVFRNVFEQEIVLTFQGRNPIILKEPDIIRETGEGIVFLYGDVGTKEVSDAKLFKELRGHQYRESMTDTLKRVAPRPVKEIHFTIGDKKPSRRRPFLMRGIDAALPAPA
jgi:hypothetical protein